MLTIDGSVGEGGGQILRTSLALSLVTGRPFCIRRIRAGRRKPGLMRQHLTAVQAAAEVSRAQVQGAQIGSLELTFEPGAVTPGTYRFAVGTAGSTTLVLQTVLPALLTAAEPSSLQLEGGTHNPAAPPFDFLEKTFLPVINRMGPRVTALLQRPGFYPAGGGAFTVAISPCDRLGQLDILERGTIVGRTARAVVSNLPRHIATRELKVVGRTMGWDEPCLRVQELSTGRGPGNVLVIEIACEHITEVFSGFGERGMRAEAVADGACREVREYLSAGVPVGRCLADQLLLPFALAGGGSFATLPLSPHARTNIGVLDSFLDLRISTVPADKTSPPGDTAEDAPVIVSLERT